MTELVRVFDGHNVRIIDEHGSPWFVAKDVAELLGYKNPSKAVADNCKGVTHSYPLRTPGGIQNVKLISESDVYRLILKSTLPDAVRFEAWVMEDVLPSIREKGRYELRERSKKVRNDFTFQLREHGCKVPIEFIKITATMKTHAGIKGNKKKDELDKIELGRIAAAEMIATVNLMIEDAKNYDDCKPICRAASVSALIATGGKVEELENGNN